MREYKFRGKCVERNKWVYGCYVKGVQEDKAYILKKHDGYWPWGDIWFVVYPETVGQFTGLHDKNGRGIYEGDIIKAKTFNYPLCIEWDRGECAFVMRSTHSGATYGFMWEIEIIGNIHDNPELMKEGSV